MVDASRDKFDVRQAIAASFLKIAFIVYSASAMTVVDNLIYARELTTVRKKE